MRSFDAPSRPAANISESDFRTGKPLGKLQRAEPDAIDPVVARLQPQQLATDGYRFHPKEGWQPVAEAPQPMAAAPAALGALETVQLVELELPRGESKRLVTRGSGRAQQVLKALGIRGRHAPGDPAQKPRM